jgi:hypothetical protein
MKFSNEKDVIEAFQWKGEEVKGYKRVENRAPEGEHLTYRDVVPLQTPYQLVIDTLQGARYASIGDYIVTGVQGEVYPCREDVFLANYKAVED